jgi:gamma-glutamyl:cysteine ligase YbdK (ATP-grasp superfamily)
MTIEEALELIPTHILLRPGKDKWQDGDEWLFEDNDWRDIRETNVGNLVGSIDQARRPIPESVRKAMAQQMLRFSGSNGFLYPFEVWLLTKPIQEKN